MPIIANLDYEQRVNRAIDYVVQHLAHPIRLDDVAQAACFSPYHFHRIFKATVGETLNAFIKRTRLERALQMMSHDRQASLTEVALACGFTSSSDFSRAVKKCFGVPPSAIDLDTLRAARRTEMQDALVPDGAQPMFERLPRGENPDGFVATLSETPARLVAYRRVYDPYSGGVVEACEELVSWADARGLSDGLWLGYMWEDPNVVPMEKCRYDAGLVVNERVDDDFVSWVQFPAGVSVRVDVRGSIELEQRALDWMYGTWLPASGYVPDHQPTFEAWHGRPFAHGFEHYELTLELPVVPVRA